MIKSNQKFNERSALIIGGSSGIGKSIANHLASQGYKICIISSNPKKLEAAILDISKKYSHTDIHSVVADISNIDQLSNGIEIANQRLGKIDILINNGGGPKFSSFDQLKLSDWDNSINLLLKSVIFSTTKLSKSMAERGWGRIITITSTVANEPSSGMVMSATLRAAVSAFMKSISIQLANNGVTVNILSPGGVLTERVNELINQRAKIENKSTSEIMEESKNSIPIGRLANPEELASYVQFLCSEEASYITGTILNIDGGLSKSVF